MVRHLPSTILQHCRGETFNFTRFSCYRLVQRSGPTCFDFCLAFYPYAQHVIRYIRSTHRHGHTCFGGEPTGSSSACYQVLWHYDGDRSLRSRAPLTSARARESAHAPPATRAGASSAASLSHGIVQATGACASGAARLSQGTGACSPSTAPPSHAPRSSKTAAPARRFFQQGCSLRPLPGHVMAVGLRCGKADTETLRSRLQLDSVCFLVIAVATLPLSSCQGGVDKLSYLVPLPQQASSLQGRRSLRWAPCCHPPEP